MPDYSYLAQGVQPTTPMMSPLQAQTQAYSLQDLMQRSQLNQLDLQQKKLALNQQMAATKLATTPGMKDPLTGVWTDEGIAALGQISPDLQQKAVVFKQDWTKANADLAKTQATTAEAQQKTRAEKEGYWHETVRDPALIAYKEAKKNGMTEEAATAAGQAVYTQGLDEVAQSGRLSKEEIAKIDRTFIPARAQANAQTYEQYLKTEAEKRKEDKTPFIKETETLEDLKTKLADMKPTDPKRQSVVNQIKEITKHIERMDAPAATTIKMQQQAAAAQQAKEPLSEAAQTGQDILAWDWLTTQKLPYRKGTGGGADRNDAVIKRGGELASQLGMTPQEVAAMPATWKANAGSLLMQTKKLDAIEGQLTSFHNNLDTWDSIAKGIAPKIGGERVKALAQDLKKIDYTGVRSIDDVKLRIEQQLNDPTASALAVSAMAAAMDYGRIMQGPQSTASLTEGVRKDAERLLAASADEKGRKGIMAALESDTEGQVKGQRDQLEKIRARMGGKAPVIEPPKTSATQTVAPASAIAHLKANPALKDAFKAKYGYLPEGM